ncbi:MAG: ATP phosphoribosyltransferase regulatory subunit [Actinomycetia bacterium]|nr:ATP phosphoribosyltransferase regulatory subunit [Actinomycetes bacterium]
MGQLQPSTEWLVDFSVMSSFDYYTGLVFVAYAPGSGYPLVSGGRYDHTLSQFGAPSAAAGFALNLERVTSALVSELAATDLAAMPPSPPISSLRVDPTALAESFRQVQALHRQGHVASLIAEEN